MKYKLRLTQAQHDEILDACDGNNPVVVLCGHRRGKNATCFMVHRILLSAYDYNETNPEINSGLVSMLVFRVKAVQSDLNFCLKNKLAKLINDRDGECIIAAFGDNKARAAFLKKEASISIDSIQIVGDDLNFYRSDFSKNAAFMESHGQAFGKKTADILRSLEIAVVGCSGIGSIVVEQLARLGVGKLVLVDPDVTEKRNLNRILNSTLLDAENSKPKVQMLSDAIKRFDLGTVVEVYARDVKDIEVLQHVADCDVIFGCVDTMYGRHYLNKLCTYYTIPYIDVGVKLVADGRGGVSDVSGAVNYIQPGKSTLVDRGVYSYEALRADVLLRTDPAYCQNLEDAGYIAKAKEPSPAVISVNMVAAGLAVCEFIARIHPYRNQSNYELAVNRFSLTGNYLINEPEDINSEVFQKFLGRGDINPLLGIPELSMEEAI